jgi:hypothetical protein
MIIGIMITGNQCLGCHGNLSKYQMMVKNVKNIVIIHVDGVNQGDEVYAVKYDQEKHVL